MARYGHISNRQNRAVLTPDGFGGVFVELVTFPVGGGRQTFTDLDSMNIFGKIVKGGYGSVSYGRDGNGYPYVEVAPYTPPAGQWVPTNIDYSSQIGIFAI
jgi:hypothetical protein